MGSDRRRRQPPEYPHRAVGPVQRAQHPDVRNLDVRRQSTPSKVYYAVWGGGVLEYDVKTERWKDYNDPDGETEMVLFKDQGLIHEITTAVSYVDKKILWVATYFGASRYDGRNWHNFLQKDSGLPSNFLNQVKALDANRAWFSTDKGLAYFDGDNWAVYRPALDTHKPEMLVRDAAGNVVPFRWKPRRRTTTSSASIFRATTSG